MNSNGKMSISVLIANLEKRGDTFKNKIDKSYFIFTELELDNLYNPIYKFDEEEFLRMMTADADKFDESIVNDSQFKLEHKFLALKYPLCWAYVYLTVSFGFFSTKFESRKHSTDNLLKIFQKQSFMAKFIPQLVTIHSTFADGNNYYIIDEAIYYPWNDIILSKLALKKLQDDKLRDMCKVNNLQKYKSQKITYPIKCLLNIVDMLKMKSNSKLLLEAQYCNPKIEALLTKDLIHNENFMNAHIMSPCINGTACVGKTTLINSIMKNIVLIDPKATILKSNKFGGFSGKDCNQVLAMQNQMTLYDAGLVYYSSIMDRDPSNNMIWRIILQLTESTENIVERFHNILLEQITPSTIYALSRIPVVIIIDTNCIENRKRMHQRSASMGDNYRCFIETYTPVQNMVFGTMALMCGWILIDRAHPSFQLHYDQVSNLIVSKVQKNIFQSVRKIPPVTSPFSMPIISNADDRCCFENAKKLHIFK